jgi:hypothetical protein
MQRPTLWSFLVVPGISTIHATPARAGEPSVVAPPSAFTTTPVVPSPQTRDVAEQGGAQRSVDAAPESVRQAPRVVEARRRSHWYGWQTLATDGVTVTLLASGIAAQRGALVAFGAATFALGGPIVHLAHGRGDAAAASLGIRVGVPFVGAFVGAVIEDCRHSDNEGCPLEGAAIGLLAGTGAAMILDTVFLAHEDIPREQPQRTARLSVSPSVSVTKSSGTMGLTGTF